MRRIIYLDTSALAKWYLNESRSEDVEKFIQENAPVDISDLTGVEMRCLLARRRREGNIDPTTEMKVFSVFEEDVRQQFLICHPMPSGTAAAAVHLFSTLPEIRLRTLDALHLAVAREIQAEILVSADRVMLAAAQAMGFDVVRFDRPGTNP